MKSNFKRADIVSVIDKNKSPSNGGSRIYVKKFLKLNTNKRAQVSIFIIIAILIVAGLFLFFILKSSLFKASVPKELEPAYNYYLSCIQGEAENAIFILEAQGGYIENPEFSPASEYMPFSNQLDFLGIPVSYWYYISGNGIENEQVPSKEKMQEQLNTYVEEGINRCSVKSFSEQGIDISFGEARVRSSIDKNSVSVDVEQELSITNGEISWSKNSHSVSVNSALGKFYDLARKIYSSSKEKMFLENYGVDILRLYAPVDGSEIGCSPKIWLTENIRRDLIIALENNIPAIKIKGSYYSGADEYFVQDIGESVDVNVNFLYLSQWPMKMEVWPSEDNMLIAEPIGLQEGMGMLGFCYVPYHFVYDFAFPVMIQLYSGAEMFQFPVVVYIEKNNPREAPNVAGLPDVVPELCEHKNTRLFVYTYNTNLEPVPANISFKCFDTSCKIGSTKVEKGDAILASNFPQCKNGHIIASAEGYKTKKYQVDTISEGEAIIILDRKYKLNLEIQRQGQKIEGSYAVVTFTKDSEVITVSYPEQSQVELTEGEYEIKAYIYTNSSISVKGSSQEKCVDVPKSGIWGIFGATEEKCFTLEIPDQIVSYAVSGGGTQEYYITESELENKKLVISAGNFGIPKKVEDLQVNYNSIEVNGLDIYFE